MITFNMWRKFHCVLFYPNYIAKPTIRILFQGKRKFNQTCCNHNLQTDRFKSRQIRPESDKLPFSDKENSEIKPESIDISEITPENQYDKLAENVTPLSNLTYEEQLQFKQSDMKDVLIRINAALKKRDCLMELNSNGLICDLDDIIPSPITSAYRNKSQFQIWESVEGVPGTVGIIMGSRAQRAISIPAHNLLLYKQSHFQVAEMFQQLIRQSKYGDNYQCLTLRSNAEEEIMAKLNIIPQRGLKYEHMRNCEIENLRNFFNGPGKDINLTSLYVKFGVGSNKESHIIGDTHLCSKMLGFEFLISPDNFFQINSPAAEVLYKTVIELVQVGPNTTLLDVGCGVGCFSVIFAPLVRETIGIDNVEDSIDSAIMNAQRNGLTNCKFYNGRAESIFPSITEQLQPDSEVVAVVNPSRHGLGKNVIDALRMCESIQRVVYVSCLPHGYPLGNFVRLCRNDQKAKGKKFVLTKAVPVDMFPQTAHCELVLLFERGCD